MDVDARLNRRFEIASAANFLVSNLEMNSVFAVSENRPRRIVVALTDDTCGQLFQKLGKLDRPVNVVIGTPEKESPIDAIQILIFSPATNRCDQSRIEEVPVAPASEVGMLIAMLRASKRAVRLRLQAPNYEIELLDDEQMRVPA